MLTRSLTSNAKNLFKTSFRNRSPLYCVLRLYTTVGRRLEISNLNHKMSMTLKDKSTIALNIEDKNRCKYNATVRSYDCPETFKESLFDCIENSLKKQQYSIANKIMTIRLDKDSKSKYEMKVPLEENSIQNQINELIQEVEYMREYIKSITKVMNEIVSLLPKKWKWSDNGVIIEGNKITIPPGQSAAMAGSFVFGKHFIRFRVHKGDHCTLHFQNPLNNSECRMLEENAENSIYMDLTNGRNAAFFADGKMDPKMVENLPKEVQIYIKNEGDSESIVEIIHSNDGIPVDQ